jgi:hypothetical protein
MRRLTVVGLLVLLPLVLSRPGPADAASAPAVDNKPRKVSVLPALAGVPFRYQGVTYRTDRAGRLSLPSSRAGVDNAIRPPAGGVPLTGGGKATFEKWYGLGTKHQTAALATYKPVSFTFSNPQEQRVPRSSLGTITLKSSLGFITPLPAASQTLLLQSTRVVPDATGLEVKDLYYTIQQVDVEGNNVVNRSQTKFVPRTVQQVNVPLLFFDATVRVHDAIFGWGVGGKLVLAYPNGASKQLAVGNGGRVSLPGLPRGQYKMSVVGPGLKIVQPVAMSRAQDVDLKVFTWLDVGTAVVVVLIVAIGLILLGRRFHRRRLAAAEHQPVVITPAAAAEPHPLEAVVVEAAVEAPVEESVEEPVEATVAALTAEELFPWSTFEPYPPRPAAPEPEPAQEAEPVVIDLDPRPVTIDLDLDHSDEDEYWPFAAYAAIWAAGTPGKDDDGSWS